MLRAINRDVTDLAVTAVVGGATDTYEPTVDLLAAQANKMDTGTLLWAAGFSVSANNGLKSVDANVAAGPPLSQ